MLTFLGPYYYLIVWVEIFFGLGSVRPSVRPFKHVDFLHEMIAFSA